MYNGKQALHERHTGAQTSNIDSANISAPGVMSRPLPPQSLGTTSPYNLWSHHRGNETSSAKVEPPKLPNQSHKLPSLRSLLNSPPPPSPAFPQYQSPIFNPTNTSYHAHILPPVSSSASSHTPSASQTAFAKVFDTTQEEQTTNGLNTHDVPPTPRVVGANYLGQDNPIHDVEMKSETDRSGGSHINISASGTIPRPIRRRGEPAARRTTRTSRCIGQKEVPGEGLCYVYEDGSYCRTVIDGEPVNPSWGITKAGKPRKRLAAACLTCREKKIRCEPSLPKCVQCQKSQRTCRGVGSQQSTPAPAVESPRTVIGSPLVPITGDISMDNNHFDHTPTNASQEEILDSMRSAAKEPIPYSSTPPIVTGDLRTHAMRDRQRLKFGHPFFKYFDSERDNSDSPNPTSADSLALAWERDPYEADKELTLYLLETYFTHIESATYCMFPKKEFISWVKNCKNKSQDDRMLLYTILAMGSNFTFDKAKRAVGKQFAAIAHHAVLSRFAKYTLQLLQSRLMLGLYYFARGKSHDSFDLSGSALRSLSALNLNSEDGILELADDGPYEYDFDRAMSLECRRRTFWAAFLMDRYNGFCGGTLFVIQLDDTFVRLPCHECEYETGKLISTTPFFDNDVVDTSIPHPESLGAMAHLTLVSAMWGEVLSFTTRYLHRPAHKYAAAYENFYTTILTRLDKWRGSLPPLFRWSIENMDVAIRDGYAGTFISLHALYHASIIRLNRHVRLDAVSQSTQSRNLAQARHHAKLLLPIIASVGKRTRDARGCDPDFAFSTPFPGYSFMLAVDVLGACGTLKELPPLIDQLESGLECVDELADFWASGKAQRKAVRTRVELLTQVARDEDAKERKGNCWRLEGELDSAFGRTEDVVYGVGDLVYLGVVGVED